MKRVSHDFPLTQVKAMRVGDPMLDTTTVGATIRLTVNFLDGILAAGKQFKYTVLDSMAF